MAAVPHRRPPGKDLTVKQRSVNRAHSRLRWPVERTTASVKTWRIFRKARCSPSRMTSSMKGRGRSSAVLVRVLPTARWDEGVLGR
ncbi:transposase family protein, partial [Streptomyces chartreusis]|uniref:transposase family protein n=1 Tax=Streptomyces chartreusis TaxID=1969 RepID=UPI0038277136